MGSVRRDPSLGVLLDGLRPAQRKLINQIFHYDNQGILEWWVDTLPPSRQRQCRVLIEMVLADIAVIEYQDMVSDLEFGGRELLKKIGIQC